MRPNHVLLLLAAALASGCGSDNKLHDDPNPGELGGDGQIPGTTEDPGNGTGTTPGNGTTPTGTGTDTTDPGNGGDPGDPGDPGGGGPNTGGSDTGEWTDTGSWGECEWAAHVAGYLDQFQTAGDGLVWYCHNDGGPVYVFQESNVDSCLTHIGHSGDIFPTTICDN